MGNILFICGSLNQTTQMHAIARNLMREHQCYFTPYYGDGIEDLFARMGLLNFTVLGGRHKRETMEYLASQNLPLDPRGESRSYDLVVTCSDLLVPKNVRNKRLILVQEGITEPESLMFHLVKWFKLPRYLANTSTNGLSDAYDIFCVASQGYADLFVRKGVKEHKIAVTGIPNFDNLKTALQNDFPIRGHVLVATSPLRETFRFDNRKAFLQKCRAIAGGRTLVFKLHPLENEKRATREIEKYAPGALVFAYGDIKPMIANADIFITQQSTSAFIALALGKEVYANLKVEELKRLMPIQNEGASAAQIARICERILHTPLEVLLTKRKLAQPRLKRERADVF
ncbi:MAG: CDP-glycerol glycerophosphotransferase family protein [Chloroflexi bacterium]|nr:CDP-glycerol glycerophosphotransferase family protein [Chloroflexota bacterium]